MNGMFDKLELLVDEQQNKFNSDIRDIVLKQQEKIKNDIQSKVPNFTQRLSMKYI